MSKIVSIPLNDGSFAVFDFSNASFTPNVYNQICSEGVGCYTLNHGFITITNINAYIGSGTPASGSICTPYACDYQSGAKSVVGYILDLPYYSANTGIMGNWRELCDNDFSLPEGGIWCNAIGTPAGSGLSEPQPAGMSSTMYIPFIPNDSLFGNNITYKITFYSDYNIQKMSSYNNYQAVSSDSSFLTLQISIGTYNSSTAQNIHYISGLSLSTPDGTTLWSQTFSSLQYQLDQGQPYTCPSGTTGTYPNCVATSCFQQYQQSTNSLVAKPYPVTVHVYSKNTGNWVSGASIFWTPAAGAYTDSTGTASFNYSYDSSYADLGVVYITAAGALGQTSTTLNLVCGQSDYTLGIDQGQYGTNGCPPWGMYVQMGVNGPGACVGSGTPCSIGEYYSTTFNACLSASGTFCGSGQIYDPHTGQCLINQASTQATTIYVKDKNGNPISGASVSVKYSTITGTTDSSGKVVLNLLTADSIWYISVSAPNYSAVTDTAVNTGSTATITMTPTYTPPSQTCPSNASGTYPNCICPNGTNYDETTNTCKAPAINTYNLIINGVYDKNTNKPLGNTSVTVKSSDGKVQSGTLAPGVSIDFPENPGVSVTVYAAYTNYQNYQFTFTMPSSNYTLTILMTPNPSITCPSGASGTYPNCTCPSGSNYDYSSNTCKTIVTTIACPSDATGNYPNCTCDNPTATYDETTNSCKFPAQPSCPANASGTYPSCICTVSNEVYDSSTNTCKQTQPSCPSNATGTYPNCTCPNGYTYNQSSNTCVANQVQGSCPSNATGAYPNCTCANGYAYNQSSNTCVANQTTKPWYQNTGVWIAIGASALIVIALIYTS